jgi:hypothetical protein
MTYTLPYFGPLDLNALIAFQGRIIRMDLNFAQNTLDQSRMAIITISLKILRNLTNKTKSLLKPISTMKTVKLLTI